MKNAIAALSILVLPMASFCLTTDEIVGPDEFSFSVPFPSEANHGNFEWRFCLTNMGFRSGIGFTYFSTDGEQTNFVRTVETLDDMKYVARLVEQTYVVFSRRRVTVDGTGPWERIGSFNFATNSVNPFRGSAVSTLSRVPCGDYEFRIDNYGSRAEHQTFVDYSGENLEEQVLRLLWSDPKFAYETMPDATYHMEDIGESRVNRSRHGWFRVRQYDSDFMSMWIGPSADPPQEVVPVPYEVLTQTEKLGFDVTNLVQSTLGVLMAWRTDSAPPYRAVLRRMAEINDPRAKVLGEVVTYGNSAFFPGNFTDVSTFVQVGTVKAVMHGEKVTPQEYSDYVGWVSSLPSANGSAAILPPDPESFVQTGNRKWANFRKSSDIRFSFDVNGRLAQGTPVASADDFSLRMVLYGAGGGPATRRTDRCVWPFTYTSWSVVPVSVAKSPSFIVPDAALSVGTGYRVTIREDDGTYDVVRAYSAMEDASDRIVVARPWKALSAHLGLKFTIDWIGTPTMQPEPEAIPDRIYFEGL